MARPDWVRDPRIPPKLSSRGLTIAALALLLPLGALTACGGEDSAPATAPAAAPAPAPASAADGGAPPPAAGLKPATPPGRAVLGAVAGFTPLPSPQQVVGPLVNGRRDDPFAPLPSPQAGSPTATLPEGFLFTGVIKSGGLTQAVVYLGGSSKTISESVSDNVSAKLFAVNSGQPTTTLCVGSRGICPGAYPNAPLLPPGWSVTGIDLRQGVLSLRQGNLPVTCRLVPPSVRPPYQPSLFTSNCTGPGVKAAAASSAASSPASPAGPAGQGGSPANQATNATPSANTDPSPAATQAPNAGRPTPR